MTLSEWCDTNNINLNSCRRGIAAAIPDGNYPNRSALWSINDYRVDGVRGGVVWMMPIFSKTQRFVFESVRNLACGTTVAHCEREIKLSKDRGDSFRAACFEQAILSGLCVDSDDELAASLS